MYISVIRADRIPVVSAVDRTMFGYFGCKLAAGQIVADSGLSWTTLRAAQFRDLQLKAAHQMTKMPVIPVPAGFRFQPVDASEVAARLVELARIRLPNEQWVSGPGRTSWPNACQTKPERDQGARDTARGGSPGAALRRARGAVDQTAQRGDLSVEGHDVVELHRGMWVAHPSAECDHSTLATPAMHPASPVTKADTMYGSAGVGDTEIPADAEVRGPDGDDQ